MTNIIPFPQSAITMSSREIAELTGRDHDNVRRDIKNLAEQLSLSFEEKVEPSTGGRPSKVFLLAKRESLILVSGYNVVLRAKIIDRWQELEAAAANPERMLNDPAVLRHVLLGYTEKVIALEAKVEEQKAIVAEQAPKVHFHDKVTEAVNCQTIQEVAKVLSTGQNRLFRLLREHKVLMASNLPYQQHLDLGRFRVVERQYNDSRGESHTYQRTLVTGKGLAFIQLLVAKHGAALPKAA